MPVQLNQTFDFEALNVPAPYVNWFQAAVGGPIVRFSFAEKVGEESQTRCAFVMTRDDAKELADLIVDILAQPAPRIKEST